MKEPFLSRFRAMILEGASGQDIHDAAQPRDRWPVSLAEQTRYVEREVGRVAAHQEHLLPLLEKFAGPSPSILDVGCSSGGTTVALALSEALQATTVVGVDPNRTALDAARVRAQGYGLATDRLRFEQTLPGQALPFPDSTFELVVCVSVLEFVGTQAARQFLVSELQRVVKPGGHVFVATPNPWQPRELHSRRFLGHFRRREGFP